MRSIMNHGKEGREKLMLTNKTARPIASPLLLVLLLQIISHVGWGQKKLTFDSSPVRFIVKNAGIKVGGTMEGLQGFLEVDPSNENLIKIEGTVDPNTVETGISLRDNHLKKEEYFDVKEYPKLHIVSTSIAKSSNGKYTGSFDLTMKGIKKNFSIPFTLIRVQGKYELKADFTLNRRDFKIGDKSFILSDDVLVKIDLKAGAKMIQ